MMGGNGGFCFLFFFQALITNPLGRTVERTEATQKVLLLRSRDTDSHNKNISPTANQLRFSVHPNALNRPGINIGKHHLHSLAHAVDAPNTRTEQLHISVPLTGPQGTKRGEPSARHTDGGKAVISVSGFSSLEFSGIMCV